MGAMNRHVWKLAAAVGVTLMAYAWAYEDQWDLPELFAIGAGAVTAGLLFWRDPPAMAR